MEVTLIQYCVLMVHEWWRTIVHFKSGFSLLGKTEKEYYHSDCGCLQIKKRDIIFFGPTLLCIMSAFYRFFFFFFIK